MRLRSLVPLLLAASGVACESPPIDWGDPVPIDQPPGSAMLVTDTAGHARFVVDSSGSTPGPVAAGLCQETLARASGVTRRAAAWWSVRPDRSAILLIALQPSQGGAWGLPIAVDTTDVSSNGCHRPPPSLAMVGDDPYVAYSMVAPEGKGVFFAHFMSAMVHSPVPVIYGDRLVSTAIAADANRVAVAYEEPNGTRAQIDVAVSATQGHVFDVHAPASRAIDNAMQPAVAFAGPTIAVSWTTRRADQGAPTRVVRVGRIR